MFVHIDPSDGVAIYEQVVRQIKFAVADGTIKTGQLIPSVRELARQLAINPNTVSRAYRELQNEQVLESVRGTGLAVSSGAAKRCQQQRLELIRARLRQVLAEAQRSGLETHELRTLIDQELARPVSKES